MDLKRTSLRRRTLIALGAVAATAGCRRAADVSPDGSPMLGLYTFGDSILDCGRYNTRGIHPGQLLVRNDDRLFPEFRGKDLQSHRAARLVHRAVDGATVDRLQQQADGLAPTGEGVALVTIGGNDLLRGLATDDGQGLRTFARTLHDFCAHLPLRPVLLGTVYDPTFGDDDRNFTGVEPRRVRANHRRVNEVITELGERFGAVADLYAHFQSGAPDWFVNTIEPSLTGASEVRRVFWSVLQAQGFASPTRQRTS